MQHIEFVYDEDPKSQGFFWPASEQKRVDYFAIKHLRPAEAESVYQCRPGSRTGAIFIDADFRYFRAPNGLDAGLRSPAVKAFVGASGGIIAQGWDTAITAEQQSDHTACVTLLLVPCNQYHRGEDPILIGACDTHFDVYVMEVYKEKVEIGDLVIAIREQHQKWQPHIVLIEKKANGTPALQALANSQIPLEGVIPVESKRERAVNGGGGAGSVQGWFRAGRVMFPQMGSPLDTEIFLPWLAGFTRELKDFTGERGGRDDQVDAMVHAIGWAIREGGASLSFQTGWQTPEGVDAQMMPGIGHNGGPSLNANPADALTQFAIADSEAFDVGILLEKGLLFDPFEGMCGRCKVGFQPPNYCRVHRRPVTTMHAACDHYDDGSLSMFSFPR